VARRRATSISGGSGKDIIVVNQPATPTRRRSSGVRRRSTTKRRRRSSSSSSGGSYKAKLIGTGIGGLAYGFIDKTFPNLPRLPLLGKAGTVAVAAYFLGGKHGLIRDVGVAAAAIAGYQLGHDGTISGVGGHYDDEHGFATEA
jgi:hypothetical protein